MNSTSPDRLAASHSRRLRTAASPRGEPIGRHERDINQESRSSLYSETEQAHISTQTAEWLRIEHCTVT